MQTVFIQYVYLIMIIVALVMLANKLKLAYPIVLVLGGLVLSFASRFSNITIDPELVFFIFLPPLLYEAAWQMSWKRFWKWRRVITSFAFPIVIITSCVVAFASHLLIPGFTLALGFLLGGIVSPPDAISASTIMRETNAPKSLVNILEGESLLNDASSLIVFRFAIAAIITGQFNMRQASITFLLVVFLGVAIGLAIGVLFYAFHRMLPTTSSIEIVLSLVIPYCMYYSAEYFHASGVLAVVSGGLYLSSRRQTLLNYRTRLQAVNVWDSLVFILNGIIFLLIGLQLPSIVSQLGDTSLASAIAYGLAISGVLIVARLMCTIGARYFTKFMALFITVQGDPGWRVPIVFGWAGMRGVVSLAAALSIPLMLENGQPFPYRNLILFITFVVILVTLVFQGLTLPWLIRKLDIKDGYEAIPEKKQETIIQKKLAQYSLEYLDEHYGDKWQQDRHLDNLYSKLKIDSELFTRLHEGNGITENPLQDFQQVYMELLDNQRQLLHKMNHKDEFDEDLIRKYLTLVDLEELKMREKLAYMTR